MSRKVLIVDDHSGFRAGARALLEAAGYEVVGEAEDGAGAITAVDALNPDVVLLDVQLPDLDGIAVASRLASPPDGPHVVLISTREASDYEGRLEQAQVDGFIHKPELSRARLEALVGTAD
jgi:DNA-binding NarL/FixJ family response regulator